MIYHDFSVNMNEEQKKLWNRLVEVLKESPLTLYESLGVLSHLSDGLENACNRSGEIFTMDEIWTRYEQKAAEKTE